jgi:flagellin-like protein
MDYKEEAVSPVIGVILMVAITVILAAIVGVFVLGLANDVQGPKEVAVTSFTDSDGTSIILQSGKDVGELTKLVVKTDGAPVAVAEMAYNGDTSAAEITGDGTVEATFSTGDVIHIDATTGALLISAEFADGDSKVLLQKKL